jgi:hypothetical protein
LQEVDKLALERFRIIFQLQREEAVEIKGTVDYAEKILGIKTFPY